MNPLDIKLSITPKTNRTIGCESVLYIIKDILPNKTRSGVVKSRIAAISCDMIPPAKQLV